eukprot:3075167-Pyramimonas_sp.AAC.1
MPPDADLLICIPPRLDSPTSPLSPSAFYHSQRAYSQTSETTTAVRCNVGCLPRCNGSRPYASSCIASSGTRLSTFRRQAPLGGEPAHAFFRPLHLSGRLSSQRSAEQSARGAL